jgi:hypothetical protein
MMVVLVLLVEVEVEVELEVELEVEELVELEVEELEVEELVELEVEEVVEVEELVELEVEELVELEVEELVELEVEELVELEVELELDVVVVVIVTQVVSQPPGAGLSGVFIGAAKSQPSEPCLVPSPQYVHASPTPAEFGRHVWFVPGGRPGRNWSPSQFSRPSWRTLSPHCVQSLRHCPGVPFASLVVLPSSQVSPLVAWVMLSPQIVQRSGASSPANAGARHSFAMPAGQVGHSAGTSGTLLTKPTSQVSLCWSTTSLPQKTGKKFVVPSATPGVAVKSQSAVTAQGSTFGFVFVTAEFVQKPAVQEPAVPL